MSLLGYNDEEDSTTINKRRCEMKQENDPVLAAIDKAKWNDTDIRRLDPESGMQYAIQGTNINIEKIRTAYLASKQQPSDGREFERVIAGIPFAAVMMFAGDIADITDAHNADRAADKQRIAELEAQVPKTVKPKFLVEIGVHHCRCYTQVKLEYSYCPNCGAKLDWSDV